jgi:hypothetical protein
MDSATSEPDAFSATATQWVLTAPKFAVKKPDNVNVAPVSAV